MRFSFVYGSRDSRGTKVSYRILCFISVLNIKQNLNVCSNRDNDRYDAKADLWSVGTVLFEMVAGRPPFMGDNHIHLLRNIQTKSLRMPEGVKVSQECVNLLRLLLNRKPKLRAGFQSFFESSNRAARDAFRNSIFTKQFLL